MPRRSIPALAALLLIWQAVPARAAMDGDNQRCVTAMHKSGLKVAAARAKQIAACVAAVRKSDTVDFAACVAADDEKVSAAVAKGDEAAFKNCGAFSPEFGVPASYDDTISEAAMVHSSGVLTDLLGGAPVVATGDDGACQAAALKATQKFVSTYLKNFAKCVATMMKEGASSGDALAPCLDADVGDDAAKLDATVTKACGNSSPATVLPGVCGGASAASAGACIATRATCRACREAATFGAFDADCDLVDDGVDNGSCSFPVTVSGNAFNFNNYTKLIGSTVWVLEHPEMTTVTDADGYFEFTVEEGEEISLVLEDPAFHPIQNGTIRVGAAGAARVTFQAVTYSTYDGLAALLGITPDPTKCQMVTTVTRLGKSIYDTGAHGEAYATVEISPALPAEKGPIYFNSSVLPQPGLTKSSDDGGVLFIQVPEGEYVWSAHKGGSLVFTRIKSKCRAGYLINASPPWGLQIH